MKPLLAFLAILSLVPLGAAQPPGRKAPLTSETIIRAQDALRMLGFELTMLETETLPSLTNPALRDDLRAHVRRVQIAVSDLQESMLPGGKSFLVYKRYSEMDHTLHELIESIDGSPFRTLALAQSAKRFNFLDTHLGGLFSAGGEGPAELLSVVLRRQAGALENAADDLYDLARNVLPADHNGLHAREAIRKYRVSAGVFRDRIDLDDGVPALRKSYSYPDQSWQRVAFDLNNLPPVQLNRLGAAAQRVDHLHNQILDTLKIEGGGYLIKERDDKVRDVLAQMQGTWFMNSYHNNGKLMSGANPNSKMVFAGNRWFRYENGKVGGGTLRVLESGAGTAKLELVASAGNATPVLVHIEGNLMRYAHFLTRPAFPGTFQPNPGDGMLSITWRRE